jgi:hypothetical protein
MVERDEQGRFKEQSPFDDSGQFKEQGPSKFDSETAKEVADETAWENHRERILKRHGLWEEWKDE